MSIQCWSLTVRVCLMQIQFHLQVFYCIWKSHTCHNNVCCGFASLCWMTLLASLFVVFFLVLFCVDSEGPHNPPHIKQHHCNSNSTTGAWYLAPLFVILSISSHLTFPSFLPSFLIPSN